MLLDLLLENSLRVLSFLAIIVGKESCLDCNTIIIYSVGLWWFRLMALLLYHQYQYHFPLFLSSSYKRGELLLCLHLSSQHHSIRPNQTICNIGQMMPNTTTFSGIMMPTFIIEDKDINIVDDDDDDDAQPVISTEETKKWLVVVVIMRLPAFEWEEICCH